MLFGQRMRQSLVRNMLTVEQQKRSIRLLHILRQTFAGHDKSSLILQNYVEGAASYQQSGFCGSEVVIQGVLPEISV